VIQPNINKILLKTKDVQFAKTCWLARTPVYGPSNPLRLETGGDKPETKAVIESETGDTICFLGYSDGLTALFPLQNRCERIWTCNHLKPM